MTPKRFVKNIGLKLGVVAVVALILYVFLKGKNADTHAAVQAAGGLAAAMPLI